MKHVILIGASGFVGSAILEELLNRGHHVTAIVRTPNKLTQSHTNLKVEVMDVEDRNALVKASGVKRVLVVGGAGSLFVKPGLRLVDTGTLPEAWLPGVKSLSKFFLETLTAEQELDWVFFSPAANLGNLQKGVRTGKFRLGKDDLIVDEKGDSFISVEDYAMAMVDELEQENHHRERFTIGY